MNAAPGSKICWARGEKTLSFGLYLGLAVLLWWNVWTRNPNTVATCGCGDPALFLWFIAWPAHAIEHGLNPFYSKALFHPNGINLLANTSVLGVGIPLIPITLIFGPVASLNVALTLLPVLSAFSAFWLFRRWVNSGLVAFIGGLLYGFSPFVLSNLEFAHLMLGALFILPLIVACLDEIIFRQRYSPVKLGVLFALLLTIQFFLSTELLVIAIVVMVLGILCLLAYGALSHRNYLKRQFRRAFTALLVAGCISILLLAYPAWFALDGPAHISGPIWNNISSLGGFEPSSFVHAQLTKEPDLYRLLGGYNGPTLPSAAYFGWGLLSVLLFGLIVWRKDRRLWLFASIALLSAALSLIKQHHIWVPWDIFYRLPLLDNIIQQRFVAITYLFVAGMLVLIIDHAAGSLVPKHTDSNLAVDRADKGISSTLPSAFNIALSVAFALALATLALAPIVAIDAPELPYTVQPLKVPLFYSSIGPNFPKNQVLLSYPAPFSGIQSAMAWQALNSMSYDQAGGGGPEGVPYRAGKQRIAFNTLASLAFGITAPPVGTYSQLLAARKAIAAWGVTMVVVAIPPGDTTVTEGRSPYYAAGFMTAVVGKAPLFYHDAWIWSNLGHSLPNDSIESGTLAECLNLWVSISPTKILDAKGSQETHLSAHAGSGSGSNRFLKVPACVLSHLVPNSTSNQSVKMLSP